MDKVGKVGFALLGLVLGLCTLLGVGLVLARVMAWAMLSSQLAYTLCLGPLLGGLGIMSLYSAHRIGCWMLCGVGGKKHKKHGA